MSDTKTFDEFWLEKGRNLVTNTVKNLNQHLSNYRKYLDTLTGLYLLSGVAAQAYFQSTNLWVFGSYIVPVAIVQYCRYLISVGQKVDLEDLDIRSPIKINDAHNKLVLSLKMGIDRAKYAVGVATVAVVIGTSIGMYNLNIDNEYNAKQKIEDDRNKELVKMEDEIQKALKKSQTFAFSLSEKKVFIMEAKFLKAQKIQITAVKEPNKDTITKIVDIPENMSFKYELNKVEEIIDVEILTEN